MLEPGTQIGRYRIIAKIGAGGMADVYQGEDTVMGRQVAVKVLPPELARDSERIARFEKEVRHLAALEHPGIVTIYDVGRENGFHFYAMALLPGGDLKQRIQQQLAPEQALDILKQTADALGFAHANRLIHRDIKPENIMFDRQGRPVVEGGAAILSVAAMKCSDWAPPTVWVTILASVLRQCFRLCQRPLSTLPTNMAD